MTKKHFYCLLVFLSLFLIGCASFTKTGHRGPALLISDFSSTPVMGFCAPIITESTIFYNNRYTDQNYHSIDPKRTQDAFFRDLKFIVRSSKIAWIELGSGVGDSIHKIYSLKHTPIDSFPTNIQSTLLQHKIDAVCIFYDVRFTHTQLVGTQAFRSTNVDSYGSSIQRKVSYKCTIMDVKTNTAHFFKEISYEDSGASLDFLEKAIRRVFQ